MDQNTQEAIETVKEAEEPAFVPEKELYTVVDIRFRDGGKNYFFDPGDFQLQPGENVIIETARGPEFGTCTAANHQIKATEIVSSLRSVIRIATAEDQKIAAENKAKEAHAFAVCCQKVKELNLDMQLVSVEWSFDGSKALFFFTADGRVDFRELVKQLASVFRTRIELRQIGVRDKAKMVGGLGVCGRPFCCREFLPDFQPVSIKMAKTQNLSLNPTKISGTCGRLMCCLKYEQDTYEELIHNSPKADSLVDTPDGRGTVVDVGLLTESVKVRLDKDQDNVSSYKICDICVLRNGKARKSDEPIPEDYAPISSRPKQEAVAETLAPVILRSEKSAAKPDKAPDADSAEHTEAAPVKSQPREPRQRRKSDRNAVPSDQNRQHVRTQVQQKAEGSDVQSSEPISVAASDSEAPAEAAKKDGQSSSRNRRNRYRHRPRNSNRSDNPGHTEHPEHKDE